PVRASRFSASRLLGDENRVSADSGDAHGGCHLRFAASAGTRNGIVRSGAPLLSAARPGYGGPPETDKQGRLGLPSAVLRKAVVLRFPQVSRLKTPSTSVESLRATAAPAVQICVHVRHVDLRSAEEVNVRAGRDGRDRC